MPRSNHPYVVDGSVKVGMLHLANFGFPFVAEQSLQGANAQKLYLLPLQRLRRTDNEHEVSTTAVNEDY
ncbi:hypothetical protein M404DRAFT_998515 [Pisolithus tinctorius Marx 270]|uniref:Uncharacterized protein n=1 Tax=Pisolithus tinctorius Marx 270 TaxID=870435 RepID=A0A0C3JDC9_PISTI|nr:hypothetical protein M404DRAFT_998515 [Pisolithus tinctorius Marx 270]